MIASFVRYALFHIILGILLFVAIAFAATQQADATHKADPYKITGTASWYECTAGWCDGTPTVALPSALGGRYTGEAHGAVTICADRCAEVLVVDWCHCYVGTANERIADLNYVAWSLISDQPLNVGLIEVTVISGGGIEDLPNTSMR